MSDKLELKHLAPYLPYGLKVKIISNGRVAILVKLGQDFSESIERRQDGSTAYPRCFDEIKPLLRPLSDLTKEITHNGETFVPIRRLFDLQYPSRKGREYYYEEVPNWTACSHYGTSAETKVLLAEFDRNPHWIVQRLYEWHFDCFGLLLKNLALPKE